MNFRATWCGACTVEMPAMEKLHQRYKNSDFVLLAVSLQETPSHVRKYVDRQNLTFTVLLDKTGRSGRQFGVRSIPTTFILNKKGELIGKTWGPRHWGGRQSIALFEHLINTVD